MFSVIEVVAFAITALPSALAIGTTDACTLCVNADGTTGATVVIKELPGTSCPKTCGARVIQIRLSLIVGLLITPMVPATLL